MHRMSKDSQRHLDSWYGQDSLEKPQTIFSFYLWTVLNGTTLD